MTRWPDDPISSVSPCLRGEIGLFAFIRAIRVSFRFPMIRWPDDPMPRGPISPLSVVRFVFCAMMDAISLSRTETFAHAQMAFDTGFNERGPGCARFRPGPDGASARSHAHARARSHGVAGARRISLRLERLQAICLGTRRAQSAQPGPS